MLYNNSETLVSAPLRGTLPMSPNPALRLPHTSCYRSWPLTSSTYTLTTLLRRGGATTGLGSCSWWVARVPLHAIPRCMLLCPPALSFALALQRRVSMGLSYCLNRPCAYHRLQQSNCCTFYRSCYTLRLASPASHLHSLDHLTLLVLF
jgi:hypothetical protein